MAQSRATLPPERSPARWLMLALVWLLYGCFGLTQGSIPPLVQPVVEDLGMTYGQMGVILGIWQLVYIGTASPLGTLVDRWGVRRSMAAGLFLILLSLVLRGLAVDFYTMLLAVALFGVGGPVISIGAPKVVALWFQGRERGMAAGAYTTGPIAGNAIALMTAAGVRTLTGTWRGIAPVYGSLLVAVMAAWWLLAREAHSSSDRPELAARMPGRQVLRRLLGIGNVRTVLMLSVGTFLLNHGLGAWLPTVLQEGGMSLSEAGRWAAAGTAAGVVGILTMPLLGRRGARVTALAALFAVTAATNVGLVTLSGPALIGAVLLSNVARGPMMPLLMLVLMETPGVGAAFMGAAAGLFFATAEIGGFGGPFLLGVLRDATGALTSGVLALAGVAVVMALAVPALRLDPGGTRGR